MEISFHTDGFAAIIQDTRNRDKARSARLKCGRPALRVLRQH